MPGKSKDSQFRQVMYLGTGEGLQIREESSTFLIQAFIIALFLILIVLIAQFNSIIDPGIIIFSVFLSMGGVFWGYALTGMSFIVIMSGIGCIALAGVAVNNCIVSGGLYESAFKAGTSLEHRYCGSRTDPSTPGTAYSYYHRTWNDSHGPRHQL